MDAGPACRGGSLRRNRAERRTNLYAHTAPPSSPMAEFVRNKTAIPGFCGVSPSPPPSVPSRFRSHHEAARTGPAGAPSPAVAASARRIADRNALFPQSVPEPSTQRSADRPGSTTPPAPGPRVSRPASAAYMLARREDRTRDLAAPLDEISRANRSAARAGLPTGPALRASRTCFEHLGT